MLRPSFEDIPVTLSEALAERVSPQFSASATPADSGPGSAMRLVVEAREGEAWRVHFRCGWDQAEDAGRAAQDLRKRPGVKEVSVSLETFNGEGRAGRAEVFRAQGLRPGGPCRADDPVASATIGATREMLARLVDGDVSRRANLSGFTNDDWELFLGNWLDQIERRAGAPAGRPDEPPLWATEGRRRPGMAALLLGLPVLALIVVLGFFQDFVGDHFLTAGPLAGAARVEARPHLSPEIAVTNWTVTPRSFEVRSHAKPGDWAAKTRVAERRRVSAD